MKRKFGIAGIGDLLATAILVAVSCVAIMPFLFMAGASLMPGSDVTAIPYRWIPDKPLWSNYYRALKGSDGSWIYLRNILNSFIVATTVATSSVLLASSVGYGLAKFKFKGRNIVFMGIMSTMMIPFEAVMIPLYLTAVKLGLQDTYAGLILPFLTSAFGVFLMRQYLLGFPEELLDAARIDGCSEPAIFRRIVFKNATPAVATLAILAFRGQWDNLLWPLLITHSERLKTIPSYIVRYTADLTADEGTLMAVAVIAALPVFVLFFSMSKYFLQGAGVYTGSKT
ncbi:carbohydrate ABC transporter permease [bacterium]|nr:carbohydrate ABC transporter permease [bacterium]